MLHVSSQVFLLTLVYRIRILMDPHWFRLAGSDSMRAKITGKNRKLRHFWSAGCSLLRVGGFFGRLDFLFGGLGISKLQFKKKNWAVNYFQILFINTRIDIKCWIRIRIADPNCGLTPAAWSCDQLKGLSYEILLFSGLRRRLQTRQQTGIRHSQVPRISCKGFSSVADPGC